jgi:uroporphyrinogen-III synthase
MKIVLTREVGFSQLPGYSYPDNAVVTQVPLTSTKYREIDEVQRDVRSLANYGSFRALVITSGRSVRYVPVARAALVIDAGVFSVGPETTRRLVNEGVVVSGEADTTALDLLEQIPEGPVLMIGASVMREELRHALEARGVEVARVACYETLPVEPSAEEIELLRSADVVVIGAPSAWSVARDHVSAGAWVVVPGATTAEVVRRDHERILTRRGQSLRELLASLDP